MMAVIIKTVLLLQEIPGFDPNVDDEASAPIDGHLWIMIMAGMVFGVSMLILTSKRAQKNQDIVKRS